MRQQTEEAQKNLNHQGESGKGKPGRVKANEPLLRLRDHRSPNRWLTNREGGWFREATKGLCYLMAGRISLHLAPGDPLRSFTARSASSNKVNTTSLALGGIQETSSLITIPMPDRIATRKRGVAKRA